MIRKCISHVTFSLVSIASLSLVDWRSMKIRCRDELDCQSSKIRNRYLDKYSRMQRQIKREANGNKEQRRNEYTYRVVRVLRYFVEGDQSPRAFITLSTRE